ncbi:DivIVA domain-containing protein [Brachybacterium sp. UNK5269]|uniref:DivIVA domain-containing protein n=1 Tax=Brachybacterium sp. UNK5269 TaxID=3408576 RepID=UPI003BB16861
MLNIRFSTTRFGEGYVMDEVDAFLDRCEQALLHRDGSLTAQEALGQRFTVTRFQEGYSMQEVDDFLDAVLVPMLEDPAAHPYDPQRDLSAGAGGAAAAPSDPAGPRHPAEPRPGFLARLLGGGR